MIEMPHDFAISSFQSASRGPAHTVARNHVTSTSEAAFKHELELR